jgi:hypothetical protein
MAEHPAQPFVGERLEPVEPVVGAPALAERVAALEEQVVALRRDLDSLRGP